MTTDLDLATRYQRDGFVVAPAAVGAELVATALSGAEAVLRGEYDTGVSPYRVQHATGADPLAAVQVAQAHQCDSALWRLVTSGELGRAIASIVGCSFGQVFATDLFVKAEQALSTADTGWHQDSPFLHHWDGEVVTAWVALTDITEESAPLLYVPGSHRQGEISGREGLRRTLAESRRLVTDRPDEDWTVVPALMPAGGMAVHNRCVVHASAGGGMARRRVALAVRIRTERARPAAGSDHPHVRNLVDPVAAPVIIGDSGLAPS